jgi:hypothetical protein
MPILSRIGISVLCLMRCHQTKTVHHMNAEQLESCRQNREELANDIKADPRKYKVCLGCSSIAFRISAVCPVCKAYRWDKSRRAVVNAATEAAKHIFPATLGYAPPTRRDYEFYPYDPTKLPVKPIAVS